jgi:acyl-CoA thioesterase
MTDSPAKHPAKHLAKHPAKQLAQNVADTMMVGDRFSALLGSELIAADVDYCELQLSVGPDHINNHDICHGGVFFTLADTAFAIACNAANQIAVAQFCQISFLAPGRKGDRLSAKARRVGGTSRSGLYDVEITRLSDGALMAAFRGHSRQLNGQVINSAEQPAG